MVKSTTIGAPPRKMEEELHPFLVATILFFLYVSTVVCYGIIAFPFLILAWNRHLSRTNAWLKSAFSILWDIFWLIGLIFWVCAVCRETRRQERERRRRLF